MQIRTGWDATVIVNTGVIWGKALGRYYSGQSLKRDEPASSGKRRPLSTLTG